MEVTASVPQIVINPSNLKDKNTGELLREQTVLLHATGKLSGLEVKVLLNAGDEPLAVNKYDISGDAFAAGKYGSIDFRLNRRHLKPLAVQVPQPHQQPAR